MQALFIPLQGFLNAIVYGWSRKEFRRAMNVKERIQYRSKAHDYESLNQTRGKTTSGSAYGGTLGMNRSVLVT